MSGAGRRKVPGRFVRLRGRVQLADRIPTDLPLDPIFLAGPSVLLGVVNEDWEQYKLVFIWLSVWDLILSFQGWAISSFRMLKHNDRLSLSYLSHIAFCSVALNVWDVLGRVG